VSERRSGSQVLYKTYKKTAGRGKVAARVASVRAALSGAITNDVDKAERLDGCYRVLGDAMDSMWKRRSSSVACWRRRALRTAVVDYFKKLIGIAPKLCKSCSQVLGIISFLYFVS